VPFSALRRAVLDQCTTASLHLRSTCLIAVAPSSPNIIARTKSHTLSCLAPASGVTFQNKQHSCTDFIDLIVRCSCPSPRSTTSTFGRHLRRRIALEPHHAHFILNRPRSRSLLSVLVASARSGPIAQPTSTVPVTAHIERHRINILKAEAMTEA